MSGEKIQKYYLALLSEKQSLSSFEKLVAEFLSCKTIDPSLIDEALSQDEIHKNNELENDLDIQRKILALNCMLELSEENEELRKPVLAAYNRSKYSTFDRDFQLIDGLIALNGQMLSVAKKRVSPKLHSTGACPMEWRGYFPWATLPQPKLQAEMGAVWAILGRVANDANLLSSASKAAEWQVNHTIDHRACPTHGLFWKENQASLLDILSANILLFHSVATFCGNSEIEDLVQKQQSFLPEKVENEDLSFLAYVSILSFWIDSLVTTPMPQQFSMQTSFCDPHVALIGARSEDSHVACTLLGSNTGLGTFCKDELSVINYGPQLLPLGDCKNFGIERTFRPENESNPEAFFEAREDGFILKGSCKVAMQTGNTSTAHLAVPGHSGIWMDVSQVYSSGELTLEVSPYGLEVNENLAFAFYVKGKSCDINGLKVSPRSLDRYEGTVETIHIRGEHSSIKIEAPSPAHSLQVIPLAGDNHFWSADFLLAYSIPVEPKVYSWKLSSTSSDS
ncbi:MAG: hypothetical protein ACI9S8_000740 [Chlamydiales bacterium]|jgi:hypothetical protein